MPSSAPPPWLRLTHGDKPVYVYPDGPDWLVPNADGDQILRIWLSTGEQDRAIWEYARQEGMPLAKAMTDAERLMAQIASVSEVPYAGREAALSLHQLKECWFHLTDHCNLTCRHCLFAASPAKKQTLPRDLLPKTLADAKRLGCRLFYFTGGEPFVYTEFPALLQEVLGDTESHVVVLTNGLLLKGRIEALRRLPLDRLHLQVSVDGGEDSHDRLRGKGTFRALQKNLDLLCAEGFSVTLAMAVERSNVEDMAVLVDIASMYGISNVHYLWYFIRGRGGPEGLVPTDELFTCLREAHAKAAAAGVYIDNIETVRSQVFAPPGTRFDLGNAAWESLAVGPDGHVYPTPALVGIPDMDCGDLKGGLEKIWRESRVLEELRRTSLIDDPGWAKNPLRFLIGGGDIDHSYVHGGAFVGHDPYVSLYCRVALWLAATEAERQPPTSAGPAVRLRMGELLTGCCHEPRDVQLTHCNCVLSGSENGGHSLVRNFYAHAAAEPKTDISNPVCYPEVEVAHIPQEARVRSYGCGSPVLDADIRPGETVVDLGSGSGVECFIAARQTGPCGKVIGVDMTDPMLALARRSLAGVARNLGYTNVEFRKGFLENLPLDSDSADVVISNCVINLSPDKRRTFAEIARVLRPGGRLVFSDVISDTPAPAAIKNAEVLRGECLAGAMVLADLMALLETCGFTALLVRKRFFYREIQGFQFFSITLEARRPLADAVEQEVLYTGPYAAILMDEGYLLRRGERRRVVLSPGERHEGSLFVLDRAGNVTNVAMDTNCTCCAPEGSSGGSDLRRGADGAAKTAAATRAPSGFLAQTTAPIRSSEPGSACCSLHAEKGTLNLFRPADKRGHLTAVRIGTIAARGAEPIVPAVGTPRHRTGCMACGASLHYRTRDIQVSCHFCGRTQTSNAACENGHFVCDLCHSEDAVDVVRQICLHTPEQDMIRLLELIRSHPSVPIHGPEHHFIVPGILVATYRNLSGAVDSEQLSMAIERGLRIPGGTCGFWGGCGAALGIGIGFGVILESTPVTPGPRQTLQQVVARVLSAISERKAARCCQRETWTALCLAAELSQSLLPCPLLANAPLVCSQQRHNRECLGPSCPLWGPPDAQA